MILSIYHFVPQTTVLGPGKRFAIWFQGCPHSCEGCIAMDSHDNAGHNMMVEELISTIHKTSDISGVTISGGEPFYQIKGLSALVSGIKDTTTHNIIVFTGYKYPELLNMKNKDVNDILEKIDMLIDGKYIRELDHGEYLRGSSNQKFIFMSELFKPNQEIFEKTKNRSFEIHFSENGEIFIAGIPPKELFKKEEENK
jgi:anaerobic ribonucleoside-triphosphate reductase activating protein